MLWEQGHGEQGLAPFAVDRGIGGSRYQNYFQAVNGTDGTILWRVKTDSQFLGQALASGGLAYAVSAKGTIYAFDEMTGSEMWRYSSGVGADEPPVIHDGVLYARGMSGHGATSGTTGSKIITESRITALDARTGEPIWSSHDNGLGMSKVVAAEGIVYSGAAYGYGSLYMYEADHGWFAGVVPFKDKVAWPAAVGDGILFLATNEGRVYALETKAPNALLT
jgi:outer membrane protein assembly factor BamB